MAQSASAPLKKTPLNARHRSLGARMVGFGGWDMPVEYSGIVDEHMAVRTRAGLFDVSHMGEIEIVDNRLKDCLDALQGRVGGTKTKARRGLPPIVPNDRQIWRVVVEKGPGPKQSSHGRGHLTGKN